MLMMSYVCLLLVYLFVPSNGLNCLHCTNVAIGSSFSSVFRGAVNRLISPLTTPKCAGAQSVSDATGVTLERCTAASQTGQVNKCGALVGTLTMSVNLYLTTIDVPFDVHMRGCFTVDQDVEGCVTDKSIINQQRGILSNTFKAINSLNLGDVDARLCVNKSIRTQQSCWIVISMLVIFLFLYLE